MVRGGPPRPGRPGRPWSGGVRCQPVGPHSENQSERLVTKHPCAWSTFTKIDPQSRQEERHGKARGSLHLHRHLSGQGRRSQPTMRSSGTSTRLGLVGTYDVGVVTKDEQGKVHIHEHELAAKRGGWGGAVVGALIGIVFPPAIPGTVLAGAAVGAAIGHLWRGLSRSDVKELGDLIDQGEAALLVVGEGKLEEALDKAELKAEKHVAKELDVLWKDVDKAVEEAAKDVS